MELVHVQEKPIYSADRRRWVSELVKHLRGVFANLEGEELQEYMDFKNLSCQEILEVCIYLELHTRQTIHANSELIKYLKTLQPKKIWSGR